MDLTQEQIDELLIRYPHLAGEVWLAVHGGKSFEQALRNARMNARFNRGSGRGEHEYSVSPDCFDNVLADALDSADWIQLLPSHYRPLAEDICAGFNQTEIAEHIGETQPRVSEMVAQMIRVAREILES